MLKRSILVLSLVFLSVTAFGQDINNYKYVIVPKTFDFLKSKDQYQLNSLSKFMFEKYGFVAIFDDEPLPEDLIKNGCLALNADVIKDSGIFKTKLVIELTNCRKELVYESNMGESDHKKSEVAYKMAIREAFDSFKTLNYKYKPAKNNDKLAEVPKTVTPIASVESKTEQSVPAVKGYSQLLYAQPIDNGYQLVDSTPKVVYTLIFSGKKDFYMVKGKQATVYKLDDNWVIAETVGDELQVQTLHIKF
jgi:hypothetical protein